MARYSTEFSGYADINYYIWSIGNYREKVTTVMTSEQTQLELEREPEELEEAIRQYIIRNSGLPIPPQGTEIKFRFQGRELYLTDLIAVEMKWSR